LDNFQAFTLDGRTYTAHNADQPYAAIAPRGLSANKFDFEVRSGDFWVGDGTAANRSELRLTSQQFEDVIWQERPPYLALKLAGNLLRIEYRYATTFPDTSAGLSAYSLSDIPRDKWHRLVMQHFVHPTDGFIRAWLNGVQVADYAGPLGYWDEETAGYWKTGIYRGASAITATMSHANVEVGTADLTARIATPLPIGA
jgi:hypothetical protein